MCTDFWPPQSLCKINFIALHIGDNMFIKIIYFLQYSTGVHILRTFMQTGMMINNYSKLD